MSFDVIVVGSGAAAVAALMKLRHQKVLVLDVGTSPSADSEFEDVSDLDAKAFRNRIVGERFESLHNIAGSYLSPKLKAPKMRFITRQWSDLTPIESSTFDPQLSLAKGGLANAWGAGVYRYGSKDLAGFPISADDLKRPYDEIEDEIGISAAPDDLSEDFGPVDRAQPAVEMSRSSVRLISTYQKKKGFFNDRGWRLGRARLAVLTETRRGRTAHNYRGLEFFRPGLSSIYNPAFTLDDILSMCPNVSYLPGHLVEDFDVFGDEESVTVRVLRIADRTPVSFVGKKLVLAAGAINSARIVLRSFKDSKTILPILDNPISYVPFFDLEQLSGRDRLDGFGGAQLNLIYEGPCASAPVQGSFYGVSAVLKSDLIFDLPLSFKHAFHSIGLFSRCLSVAQLFYPDEPTLGNGIRLKEDLKVLSIAYESRKEYGTVERNLIKTLLKFGYISAPWLCKYPDPGNSFHYAGTLPMTREPSRYQVSPDGLLWGTKNVFVTDASTFPRLPAKNHTLTLMANSLRIAEKIS